MLRSLFHSPYPGVPRGLCAVALAAATLACAPVSGAGQNIPALPDSTTRQSAGISPGGALLRAFLVPGWGHASIGSYGRGAFYFLAEGTSLWMMSRSQLRLAEAQARIRLREARLGADLADEGITDPFEIQDRLDQDPAMQDLQGLEDARSSQREDWLALSIFLALISGVDAYVSAHLQDFPDPIEVNVQPIGQGRIEVSGRLRLPN